MYASFHHAPSPERCFDCQGIRLYPNSTGHGAEHVRGTRSPWLPAGLPRFRWSPVSVMSTWSRVAWPSFWSRPSECEHATAPGSDSPFVLTIEESHWLAACIDSSTHRSVSKYHGMSETTLVVIFRKIATFLRPCPDTFLGQKYLSQNSLQSADGQRDHLGTFWILCN